MEHEYNEDSDMDDASAISQIGTNQDTKMLEPSSLTPSSSEDMEDVEEDEYSEGEESEELSEEDDAFDAALIYEKEATEHQFLKEDVKMAAKEWLKLEHELCIPSVQIEPPASGNEGMCSVVLTINVSTLPDMIRKLWELGAAMTVSVVVDGIHKEEYRKFERRPIVLARVDTEKPSKFPVGECLINVVKPLVTDNYSLEENVSPSMTGSFFSMLYKHMMERFNTLTEFCMVCGSKLYAGGLLPSICDGELCQYQYQELGLLEGLTTPRVSAPVLSLLMMAFNAAAGSGRWKDILTPAPKARDQARLVKEAKELYKKHDRKWHFSEGGLDVHSQLANVLPCAHDILETSAHYRDFKKSMPSLAEFVEWLVISNQSYLELVPPHLNVSFLQTAKQFLFVADTPQKQAEFDALVKENGGKTRYLFHGSRSENWHSIIRTGLKNMSGTKYQLVGAAYGAGIYLSNHLNTSYHYCSRFDERSISENCSNKTCFMSSVAGGMTLLAVVEVVDTPDAFRHDANTIVVVKEEKWCSIRMLVVYSGHSIPNVDLNQMSPEDRKKIQEVIHMFKNADLLERVKHA